MSDARSKRSTRGALATLLGAALLVAAAPAAAQQVDARALYESRCRACHERSVHSRAHRVATDFAAIRAFVVRWDRELGAAWRPDEIDAVTRYLNDTYYRFPCPAQVCAAPRARLELAPAASAAGARAAGASAGR